MRDDEGEQARRAAAAALSTRPTWPHLHAAQPGARGGQQRLGVPGQGGGKQAAASPGQLGVLRLDALPLELQVRLAAAAHHQLRLGHGHRRAIEGELHWRRRAAAARAADGGGGCRLLPLPLPPSERRRCCWPRRGPLLQPLLLVCLVRCTGAAGLHSQEGGECHSVQCLQGPQKVCKLRVQNSLCAAMQEVAMRVQAA